VFHRSDPVPENVGELRLPTLQQRGLAGLTEGPDQFIDLGQVQKPLFPRLPQQQKELRRLLRLLDRVGRILQRRAGDYGTVVGEQHGLVVGSEFADGRARAYRIYVMEKMRAGYEPEPHDWRFAAYGSNGALVGETGGRNDARVRFCAECHAAARAQDFSIYVPPTYRIPVDAAPQ
jgi:hypothetical protein